MLPNPHYAQPQKDGVSGLAFSDYFLRFEITPALLGYVSGSSVSGSYSIPLPAGVTVLNVRSIVKTAFDGSATMTIGDSGQAAGYLASAAITPTVASAVAQSETSVGAYKTGKYLPNASSIVVAAAVMSSANGKIVVDVVLDGFGAKPKDVLMPGVA